MTLKVFRLDGLFGFFESFSVTLIGVELRSFWCGTEGFFVLDRGGLCGSEGYSYENCNLYVCEIQLMNIVSYFELLTLHHFKFEILTACALRIYTVKKCNCGKTSQSFLRKFA